MSFVASFLEHSVVLCLAVRTGCLSSVHVALFAAAAAGLMSSLRRLKTCSLRRTLNMRLITISHHSLCKRTCTEPTFKLLRQNPRAKPVRDISLRTVTTVPKLDCHKFVQTVHQPNCFLTVLSLFTARQLGEVLNEAMLSRPRPRPKFWP